MTVAQQIEDLVIAQRKLLWPLPPAERAHRVAEIRADYEYENQLSLVADAMSEEEIEQEPRQIDWTIARDVLGALAINFGALAVLGVLGWEIFRP